MNGSNHFMVISHRELRRLVGGLGALLPVIVGVSGFIQCRCPLQPTISHYYDLGGMTRDLFVGILFAIATFLWTYRGYDEGDKWTARFASACAFGVALFPHSGSPLQSVLHFGSAVGLFGAFAHFALCLFPRSGAAPTPEKQRRNRIYKVCGWLIVLCVAGIVALVLAERVGLGRAFLPLKPIYWLECLAVWAFAVSWLVKGEVAFRDAHVGRTHRSGAPAQKG